VYRAIVYQWIETLRTDFDLAWYGDSLAAKCFLAYCRILPNHPMKLRICRWVAQNFFRSEISVRNNFGARLLIDPSDFIGHGIAFDGGYEPKSLACAMRVMNQGGTFVDVGCSFGLYAITLGSLPNVCGIAIDASYTALAKLHRNLLRNPTASVKTVNGALSRRLELHCFETPVETNSGTTRLAKSKELYSNSRFWVAGTTLQTVLDRLAKSEVKLLKIDVEGQELSVFEDFDWNGPFRPLNIIVECDPEVGNTVNDCFELLKAKGYEALTVEGKSIKYPGLPPEHNVWFRQSN
jgi:FkbM family methyltransferase